jgi:nucleoid-associated protein YgaU
MNRDAKIGIVVILIIVGFLVIVWGRNDGNDTDGLPPGNIEDTLKDPGDTLKVRATSPDTSAILMKDQLPLGPDVTKRPLVDDKKLDDKDTTVKKTEPTGKRWTYTVVAGDTGLEPIARRELGDGTRWPEIAKLNNLERPYRIFLKQTLKMPPRGKKAPSTTAKTPATTDTVVTPERAMSGKRKYVVKAGDLGIFEIAREQLGNGKLMKDIIALNKLRPPFTVVAGDVLWLPTYDK